MYSIIIKEISSHNHYFLDVFVITLQILFLFQDLILRKRGEDMIWAKS